MGLIDTEAIVLRVYPLAEADKIVVLLTRDTGVIRGVAKGARRLKSKFGAGLEPFTLLHLSYHEKEGRELVTLRQTEIERSYFKLSEHAGTIAALSYLGELVLEFAPPHEPNEKLFRMVRAILEAAVRAPAETGKLARYFEVWMLKLAGLLPELQRCAECGKDLKEVEQAYLNAEFKLRCPACSRTLGLLVSAVTRTQVRSIQRLSPSEYVLRERGAGGELGQLTQKLINHALERVPRGQSSFN